MAYTHRILWEETLTAGTLKGMEVTKDFPIVNPGSLANQNCLLRLRLDPKVRNARIVENGLKYTQRSF